VREWRINYDETYLETQGYTHSVDLPAPQPGISLPEYTHMYSIYTHQYTYVQDMPEWLIFNDV
jgi:hypothetical protein